MNGEDVLAIDVGGTSIKYAVWSGNKLGGVKSVDTPNNLDDFYSILINIRHQFENISGVGFSIPGAVDQKSGVIGGISALPYIHNFKIQEELEHILNLPVRMENDANCAALAEIADGSAKNMDDVVFVVIGTGVGGAVILDRHIVHGKHLLAGELGITLGLENNQISTVSTAVNMAKVYNKMYKTKYTGKDLFELEQAGEEEASSVLNQMYENLAHVIFNLQFVVDPEAIIIGGAVSKNEYFINKLNEQIKLVSKNVADVPFVPQVIPATYNNDANLIGAVYNFNN